MAAAGAAGLVWPAEAVERESDSVAILATPCLLDILRDHRVAYDLGRRYRKMMPAENSVRALTEAILVDLNAMAPAPLDMRVNDQVQRDFACGRTLTLNGWILSVTEARQCALYSLLQQPA